MPAPEQVRSRDELLWADRSRCDSSQLVAVQKQLAHAESERLRMHKLLSEELAKERKAHEQSRHMLQVLRSTLDETTRILEHERLEHEREQAEQQVYNERSPAYKSAEIMRLAKCISDKDSELAHHATLLFECST